MISENITVNKIILLVLILMLCLARFLYLGTVPGLHEDEALYGIKTYIMMHGNPFTLTGFNAYTGPIISYLRIPFFYIFGVNIFSLRFPIVILSLITIFFIYRLLREAYGKSTGMIGALLFLTMPWSFIYSRFSDETHTALIFFAIGGLYYLTTNTRLSSRILAGLFLGTGVFNHFVFVGVVISYFVYFFIVHRHKVKIDKGWIVFFIIFSIFLLFRISLILYARAYNLQGDRMHYYLDQAVGSTFIYKFVSSIVHFMNMMNGSIFYKRTVGEVVFWVLPLNSIIFIISFLYLAASKYRTTHQFKDKDRMFICIFILIYIITCIFSIELALRYFLVTLVFATILIAIFLGTVRIKKTLRIALVSLILATNSLYITYNYIYSFRKHGGRASVFWAGNFFENSVNFIDSTVLYDYLKQNYIRYICVPEKVIRFPLIFLDLNSKNLNIEARLEDVSGNSVHFVLYKDDVPRMHVSDSDYSISQKIAHLKNYDIFLMER